MKQLLRPALVLVLLSLTGCPPGSGEGLDQNGRPIGENPDSGAPAPAASFKQVQDEIFTPMCIVCHSGAAAPVGLKLDSANSYASLVSVASVEVPSLLRVAPGDPDSSYLVQKIEGTADVGAQMPLGGPAVPAELVNALRVWVERGALPDTGVGSDPVIPGIVTTVPANSSVLANTPDDIVIVFNTTMDFSLLNNQTVSLEYAGEDGLFDTSDDETVEPTALSSSNPQTLIVRLQGLLLGDGNYRLRLAGEGSLVLASLEGITIDGNSDGESGGDFDLLFSILSDVPSPEASWRWIQDNVFTPICVQCHASGGIASFLQLDEANSFAMLVNQFSTGTNTVLLVAPGDADNSYLIQKVEGTAAVGGRMPLGLSPLGEDTIVAMREWINAGALLEPGDPMPDTVVPEVSLAVPAGELQGVVGINVAAADNVGVTAVRILVDGIEVASQTSSPFAFELDTNELSDGQHSVFAEADDASGNTGTSEAVEILVMNAPPPDLEAPSVAINAFDDPASGTIEVSVSASDNVGVATVRLSIDGAIITSTNVAPYIFMLDTTTLGNGDHVVGAQAEDAAGNIGIASDVTLTVDNTSLIDLQSPDVAFAPVSSPVSGVFQVTASATDNVGVTDVTLLIDGSAYASLTIPPYTFSVDSVTLNDGVHVLGMLASDAAGNTGTAVEQTVTIDNSPPPDAEAPVVTVSSILSPVSGVIAVTVAATDNVGVTTVDLLIDNNVVASINAAPYLFMVDSTILSDGTHTIGAQATDTAGNIGITMAQTVTVDNAPPPDIDPPEVNILPVSSPVSGTFTVEIDAIDNVGVTGVDLLVDNTVIESLTSAPYVFTIDSTSLSDGTHVLGATAADAAGNVGTAGTISITVDNAPPPDLQPPQLSILPPIGNISGTVNITVNASDNTAVTAVSLYADGTLLGTESSTPFIFQFDVSSLSDGVHLLGASAQDAAGNTGAAPPLGVTIENGTPQPTLAWIQENVFSVSCAAGCHSAGSFASFLLLTDGDSFGSLVNVATTEGGPNLRVAPFDADNSALVQRLEGTLTPSMPFGGSLLPSDVVMAVRDWVNAGATENAADTIAPAVAIVLPIQPASGTITLSAAAVDDADVTAVRFIVDGNEVGSDTTAPYAISLDTTVLTNGDHAIDAVAEDAAGNVGSAVSQTLTVTNN